MTPFRRNLRLPPPRIQLVFNSGRKTERVVQATVVASDKYRDLAILKVTGLKDAPKPIDLTQKVELAETMKVHMFGFPFGQALSTTKGNPAMTIGTGSVSSIREDDRGDVAVVQIDGDLNPGNSGGPVVDAKGRLVGVAVAKILGSRIGLAIPPGELTKMLNGRVSAIGFRPIKVADGSAELEVSMQFIDPLNKIKSAAVRYARSDSLQEKVRPNKEGVWPVLPGSEKLELKVEAQTGKAKLVLKAGPSKGPVGFEFQPEIVNGEGKTVYSAPSPYRIDFAKTVAPPGPLPIGKVPEPKESTEALAGTERTVADLKVVDLKLTSAGVPRCLCWADDAKAFYFLQADGVLRRVKVPEFKEDLRLEVGKKCSWLSPSAEGLVLTVAELQEVWLLDAKTFQVKKKVASPSVQRTASSPKLSVVFAIARGDSLNVIDLKTGELVKEYTGSDFPGKLLGFGGPVVTADGKLLFTTGGIEQVHRFKIDGRELKFDESSPRIVQGRFEGIDVSPDGAFVCAASGGGNYGIAGTPFPGTYSTYLFAVGNLQKPAVILKQGAYPVTVGFDPKAGLIYGQNFGTDFIVFTDKGVKQKEYKVGAGGLGLRQFLVHPDGRKVLVLGDKVCWVELPKPSGERTGGLERAAGLVPAARTRLPVPLRPVEFAFKLVWERPFPPDGPKYAASTTRRPTAPRHRPARRAWTV